MNHLIKSRTISSKGNCVVTLILSDFSKVTQLVSDKAWLQSQSLPRVSCWSVLGEKNLPVTHWMFQKFTFRLKPTSPSIGNWFSLPFLPTSALLTGLPCSCVWAEVTPWVSSLLVLHGGCVWLGLLSDPPATCLPARRYYQVLAVSLSVSWLLPWFYLLGLPWPLTFRLDSGPLGMVPSLCCFTCLCPSWSI